MEWAGILVGIVLGTLLGVILGLQLAPGSTKRGGTLPLPFPPGDRDGYVKRADLEHMELRLEDAYDKLHHLYDRTRKRLKVPDDPQPPAKEVQQLTTSSKEIKAAIRERIRLRRVRQ